MIINAKDKNTLSIFEKNLIRLILEEDKIIAFPTDTVYGFGVNGMSRNAVANLYALKKRHENKPLILLTDHPQKVAPFLLNPKLLEHPLLKKHWPGALTAVFDVHEGIPLLFSMQKYDSLGIRMPNHQLLLDFLAFLPFPLVTSSANLSDEEPLQSAIDIETTFNLPGKMDKIACIIDQGKLSQTASTVIQLTGSSVVVLRKGSIKLHDAALS